MFFFCHLIRNLLDEKFEVVCAISSVFQLVQKAGSIVTSIITICAVSKACVYKQMYTCISNLHLFNIPIGSTGGKWEKRSQFSQSFDSLQLLAPFWGLNFSKKARRFYRFQKQIWEPFRESNRSVKSSFHNGDQIANPKSPTNQLAQRGMAKREISLQSSLQIFRIAAFAMKPDDASACPPWMWTCWSAHAQTFGQPSTISCQKWALQKKGTVWSTL